MLRVTTSGVLKSYRLNLNQSHSNLVSAQNTVLTQRNFNSYAEDPATASECFTLRRAYLRNSAQQNVCSTVISQYDVAWSTLDNVISNVSNQQSSSAWATVMEGISDTSGSGRQALGNSLLQMADSLTQAMNVKYGDSYVFSGAHGLTPPFSWNGDQLCYQGVPVDTPDCTGLTLSEDDDGNTVVVDADGNPVDNVTVEDYNNWQKLQSLSKETRYVDIGLGMQEDNDTLISSTAFDASMPGINYLGYGVDENGDPNNVISIIKRMGTLLAGCDSDGNWANSTDSEELTRLFEKFGDISSNLSKSHVQMDTQASFLKSNLEQLENSAYTINEQIVDLEEVDLAEAITSFAWAQYCYNAALKVGNSILSETLMDYMN